MLFLSLLEFVFYMLDHQHWCACFVSLWTIRSSKTKCLSDSSLDLEKYLTHSGCAVLMNESIKQQTTKLLSSWYIYDTIFILNNNNNKIYIYTKANWYLIWALSPVAIKLFIIQILDLQFIYNKLESITLLNFIIIHTSMG